MSLSAKRLRRAAASAAGTIVTSAAYMGRGSSYNGATGWTPTPPNQRIPTPAAMPLYNATLLSIGYGEGLALMPDRTLLVWGQNAAGNVPWSFGPEGLWAGVWEYRTDLLKQTELEGEGFTRPQIEAKERSFAIRIAGQLIYSAGHIVIYEGSTWEAQRENCATPPGSDPTAWALANPQIPQSLKPTSKGPKWFVYAYNLGMARPAPMMSNVSSFNYAGSKGVAVLMDGTLRTFGHGIRWGGFGTGIDGSYGPKPRPLQPDSAKPYSFRGRLTKGSNVITELSETRPSHDHHAGVEKLSATLGNKAGSRMLMPTPFTGVTGVAATNIFTKTAHKLENGTAVHLSELMGGAGLSVGLDYFVIGATANTFKLSATVGGAEVDFTTDLTSATLAVLGLAAGALVTSATDHEVLDEEGHSFSPQHRELDTITVNAPAAYDYVGWMYGKIPRREQPFWGLKEGALQAAAFPARPKLPVGVKCVAAVTNSDGGNHTWSLALTDTGEVLTWGSSATGQQADLGPVGETHYNLYPTYAKEAGGANLKNIVAIALGEVMCMALDSSHQVWVWGNINQGQAGPTPWAAKTKRSSTPLKVDGLPTTVGERPVAICAARSTCYALLENGKVMAWGANEHGQCGNGVVDEKGAEPRATPALVSVLANVKYLEAGRWHAGAVTIAGALYTWGWCDAGQLGIGTSGKDGGIEDDPTPKLIPLGGAKALSVTCSEYNTAVVLDGTSTLLNRVQIKLVPQGEITGEPSAYLRLRWEAEPGIVGWRITYRRQPNWWEEAEAEALKQELEAAIESGELTKEEEETAEEELEVLEIEEEEREEGATRLEISPTETSPGVYEYQWESPGRLTPNSGYIVVLQNPTHAGFHPASIFTNGLWGSPFV